MQKGLDLNSIKMDKEIYTEIKNNKSNYPKYMVAIAGILATYNSKWFAGFASPHYVSPKCTRYYYQESINNVLKQMPNLTNVKFISGDYKKSCANIHNAMIYCDPPYENTTGFKDKFNHSEYWDWVRRISKDNFVLCSEYNAPDDFVEIWSGKTQISLDHNNRNKATERLFTYKNGKYVEYVNQ